MHFEFDLASFRFLDTFCFSGRGFSFCYQRQGKDWNCGLWVYWLWLSMSIIRLCKSISKTSSSTTHNIILFLPVLLSNAKIQKQRVHQKTQTCHIYFNTICSKNKITKFMFLFLCHLKHLTKYLFSYNTSFV